MLTDWIPLDLPRPVDRELIARQVAGDPRAAAIDGQEAEAFTSAMLALHLMSVEDFAETVKAAGLRYEGSGAKARRKATMRLLRKWQVPHIRKLLSGSAARISLGAWLSLQGAAEQHEFYLNAGRLTLRRHVYGDGAARESLARELRAKDQESERLRLDMRRLVQDGKRLREEARRREQANREALAQARGEVAAARRLLREQKAQWERELAEQERRLEAEASRLTKRLAAVRAEFARQLSDLPASFLGGRSVGVRAADEPGARLLVETLGGSWAPPRAGEASVGLADLERHLHGMALHGAVLRCDGSCRQQEGRPPIATSAFQVWVDGRPVHAQHQVICCEPTATSMMAEYGALVMALGWLAAAEPPAGTEVEVWSDCKSLLGYLAGRCPEPEEWGCIRLKIRLRSHLRRLERGGCRVRLKWAERDLVYAEDRLCERAYREADWYRSQAAPHLSLSRFLWPSESEGGRPG